AKLLQVLDGKDIEGLAGDDHAHDQRDGDREPKIHGNAGVPDEIKDRHPSELVAGHGLEPRSGTDAPCQLGYWNTRRCFDQHEGQQLALASDKIERLAIAGVENRESGEGSRSIYDSHDLGAVIVHLERLSQFQRLAGEKEVIAG